MRAQSAAPAAGFLLAFFTALAFAQGPSAGAVKARLGKINYGSAGVGSPPKTRQRLLEIGAEPVGGPEQSFAARYRADYRDWGQVIKESGIQLE